MMKCFFMHGYWGANGDGSYDEVNVVSVLYTSSQCYLRVYHPSFDAYHELENFLAFLQLKYPPYMSMYAE